jgi:hypothetical protein
MLNRRTCLKSLGASLLAAGLDQRATAAAAPQRKKMAIVTTEWRYLSHAQHMGDRFLVGYPLNGRWHAPQLDVVSLYVDQKPKGDQSAQRAEEFGFKVYPTIAQALRCGGERLAVDAVLVIGEHGKYPRNKFGQVLYPRYEFFRQVVDVFKKDGRTTPVFNDKHLSWKWEWAKEMVDTAKEMHFPLMAGSSLPVTWRMPAIDMPYGAEVDEIVCVAMGGLDSYDFHALEVIQCMAERRRGSETGVTWLQAQRGENVWKGLAAGSFEAGGLDPRLFAACLSRSQTLAQARAGFGHRYPSSDEMRSLVKDPVAYRFQYADGLKATMLLMNGLVDDFTFAARLKGRDEPLSTLFYLPPNPNVHYSACSCRKRKGCSSPAKCRIRWSAPCSRRAWSPWGWSPWPRARSGSKRRICRSATQRRRNPHSSNHEIGGFKVGHAVHAESCLSATTACTACPTAARARDVTSPRVRPARISSHRRPAPAARRTSGLSYRRCMKYSTMSRALTPAMVKAAATFSGPRLDCAAATVRASSNNKPAKTV